MVLKVHDHKRCSECFLLHNVLSCFQPRSAAGANVSQSAQFTNQVSQAANGSQMSTEAYRAKHEITIIVCPQLILYPQSLLFVFLMLLSFSILLLTGQRGTSTIHDISVHRFPFRDSKGGRFTKCTPINVFCRIPF
jgi:hypothetical protein